MTKTLHAIAGNIPCALKYPLWTYLLTFNNAVNYTDYTMWVMDK